MRILNQFNQRQINHNRSLGKFLQLPCVGKQMFYDIIAFAKNVNTLGGKNIRKTMSHSATIRIY
jgi:hypothetical protein